MINQTIYLLAIRGLILKITRISLLLLFVFNSIPSNADGFGWYPLLFDYPKLTNDYDKRLRRSLENKEKEDYSAPLKARYSDWVIVDYLQEHTEEYAVEYPQSYTGDLLTHEMLMFLAKRIKSQFPNSPAKHLLTGRVTIKSNDIRPCTGPTGHLIHGDCRTAVIFSPKEIKEIFWQLTQILNEQSNSESSLKAKSRQLAVSSADDWRKFEKLRIYYVLKEAALKDKGTYFYGHD